MLVVAVPEAAGPWWRHDRDDRSDHQGAGVDPADRLGRGVAGDNRLRVIAAGERITL